MPKLKPQYHLESRKVAKQRRLRPLVKKITRVSLLIFTILVVVAVIFAEKKGYFDIAADKISGSFNESSAEMGLVVENIYIEGLDNLSKKEVLSVLPHFENEIPVLSVSLKDMKKRLESMGWVEVAEVERQLPNSLHVRVKERIPRAIWQNKGALSLVDYGGDVILSGDEERSDFVADFPDLPVIVGADANLYVGYLLGFMDEESDLANRVASIIRVGGRRWNVRLSGGVEIKLPEEHPEIAWKKLAEIHAEKQLLDRAIKSIDLRVVDRLIIQLDDE